MELNRGSGCEGPGTEGRCHVRATGRVEELFKSKLLQLLTCSFMINMAKAMYTESFGHLYKHGPVFNIHYLLRINLCSIQGDAENVGIRFSEMNKTGKNKKIRKRIKFKLLCAVFC